MYRSTRSDRAAVSSEYALLEGIAPDGGLYVPESMPLLDPAVFGMETISYQELSYLVLQPFFPNFSADGLKGAFAAQAERFPARGPAPVKHRNGMAFLELYRGPTLALKISR